MNETAPSPPRQWPIAAACALVIASIVAVAAVRVSGMPITAPDAAPVAERQLRFVDRADGSIAVLDAQSGLLVDSVVGEAGFVRGTLRGLARERKRQGIGADQAFRLVARADGRLTLLDPATGRRVDLESFGPTNASEFAHMLIAAERLSAAAPRN